MNVREVFSMGQASGFDDDIEAHYRTLLYDLDLVAYNNCNYDGEPIPFRKSLLTMAQALASAAIVDPSRTREASYNLSQIAKAVDHPLLTKKRDRFNSDHLRIVHEALACGLYRLVSGRDAYDGKQKGACEALLAIMGKNKASDQGLCAVDVISGTFEMYGNLQALLALRLYDKQHGTSWSRDVDDVLDSLEARLIDDETGLFYDSFHTGALGFTREILAPSAFWPATVVSPATNALAICLYHYFRPAKAERMWQSFKGRFADELMGTTSADMAPFVGTSYLTELGGSLEGLMAALQCAREMQDEDFFVMLHEHLFSLLEPRHVEVKIVYDGLEGGEAPLPVYFGLLSQIHQPWCDVLDGYPWEMHRDENFNRVR